MTIGQSIVDWLMEFGDIEASDTVIETDQLDSNTGSMGLYKQPNKDIRPFVDGSRDVTEDYYLLARQPSKDERSRIATQAWMEAPVRLLQLHLLPLPLPRLLLLRLLRLPRPLLPRLLRQAVPARSRSPLRCPARSLTSRSQPVPALSAVMSLRSWKP